MLVVLSVYSFGCATVSPPPDDGGVDYPQPDRSGVYHKVKDGETLWRIAKTYDVEMRDIVQYNNIPDIARVEENQLIFIPGVYSVREVLTNTALGDKNFIWPVQGKVIRFFNDVFRGRRNKGIDIAVDRGSVVRAARAGKVVFVDDLMGHGKTIILDHQDGFFSVYANNSKALVKLGDLVAKNADIAHIGQCHEVAFLHFEIRKNSKEENPFYYLP
jgi:lipoprotein NlpD